MGPYRESARLPRYNARSVGNWILFVFTLQHALLSWLIGLILMATFFAHRPRFEGAGIMTLEWRPWFAKRYRYSVTILRLIVWGPGYRELDPNDVDTELDEWHERHERVHIRQMEDAAVQGFYLGLTLASISWVFGWYGSAWQPAVTWELAWMLYPMMTVTNWATAVLRWGLAPKVRARGGKDRSWWQRLADVAYRDSEHERSAFAQTDLMLRKVSVPGSDELVEVQSSWTEKRDDQRAG